MKIALTFICSCILGFVAQAQGIRIDAIRVGIDPIRSWSMLAKEKDNYNNRFYYNACEGNIEIIGPERTTLILDIGYTRSHINALQGTFDYYSQGSFFRLGFDFNLLDAHEKRELHLGWRVGTNSYTESATIRLEGKYWERKVAEELPSNNKSVIWGEILTTYRIKGIQFSEHLSNWSFSTTLRMKFLPNNSIAAENYKSLMIPGYGPYNPLSYGLTFSLAYRFNIHHSLIHELMHKHHNEFKVIR